jgi:hypothetical protein
MISILFLIVLVALAGGSPVFAQPAPITFDPPAACPGETVTVTIALSGIVGGGISVAAVSPLSDGTTIVLSSDPVGLIANQACFAGVSSPFCTFVVSEAATCGGHYTVTVTLSFDSAFRVAISDPFDVPNTCCPVGGCVQPVNTFALLSPWLLAIVLVGCIGTVAVVAKKRHP